jgi:hypothetical protein
MLSNCCYMQNRNCYGPYAYMAKRPFFFKASKCQNAIRKSWESICRPQKLLEQRQDYWWHSSFNICTAYCLQVEGFVFNFGATKRTRPYVSCTLQFLRQWRGNNRQWKPQNLRNRAALHQQQLYSAVHISWNLRGEEVEKEKRKRRHEASTLFYGTKCQWTIPVPNTSVARTLRSCTGTLM